MGHIVEFRTNSSNNQKKPMKSSNMRGILCKGENNHAKGYVLAQIKKVYHTFVNTIICINEKP
jgi:hypothetical protein